MNQTRMLRWSCLVSCVLAGAQMGCQNADPKTPTEAKTGDKVDAGSVAQARGTEVFKPVAAVASVVLPNHAPANFTQVRPAISKGKLETITYNSKSVGVDRKAVVYKRHRGLILVRATRCFT